MYYRVSSNNIGVYQAFKKMAGQKKWHEVLKVSKWLPKPPSYKDGYRSYFTEKGFEKFSSLVLPVMKDLIDVSIEQFESIPGETIYTDKYQIVKAQQ